jgi:short-subunit dehydrogenase
VKVVLLGATKGMGRALARRMAERGDRLFLLGRNEKDLAISARDLELCGAAAPVGTAPSDLSIPESFGPALDRAESALGGLDVVVLSAALFATQESLEGDFDLRQRMLVADFTNSVAFCEEARMRLMARGGGTLCAFSSVAGERPRKPVAFYGAAKAGLSHYLESMDLRYRSRGLSVVCVKPGFVRTGMTAGLDAPPFAGEPDAVARVVLRAIDRRRPVVYAPPVWRWIMVAIRLMPRALLRRIEF